MAELEEREDEVEEEEEEDRAEMDEDEILLEDEEMWRVGILGALDVEGEVSSSEIAGKELSGEEKHDGGEGTVESGGGGGDTITVEREIELAQGEGVIETEGCKKGNGGETDVGLVSLSDDDSPLLFIFKNSKRERNNIYWGYVVLCISAIFVIIACFLRAWLRFKVPYTSARSKKD